MIAVFVCLFTCLLSFCIIAVILFGGVLLMSILLDHNPCLYLVFFLALVFGF